MSGSSLDPLNLRLSAILPAESHMILTEALWGNHLKKKLTLDGLGLPEKSLVPFFRYYSQQCDLATLHGNTTLSTHRQVVDVAALLRQPGATWQCLPPQLSHVIGQGTDEQHQRALHLVSRLLTMMRIGDVPQEFSRGRSINWGKATLADFVNGHFSSTPALSHERIKFEKTFNVLSLLKVAGLEVQWTDNLADHLRLANDDRVVRVFHHATFLLGQEESEIFPSGFIGETKRTLALLFPKYDERVRKWCSTQAAKHGLDPAIMDCGHLIADERQIENFTFWRDRFVVLKQVYDESRPNTITQWWHDRRNGVQWYTFWVAILVLFLTVFFGLIQSIEGALQVYLAFHPVGS